MNTTHFTLVREPLAYERYLILNGPRTGRVLPGNMITAREGLFARVAEEDITAVNPEVAVGDRIIPLRMAESRIDIKTVTRVVEQGKSIQAEGYSDLDMWVRVANDDDIPALEREIFLLKVREDATLRGFESEAQRRDWSYDWTSVLSEAGFDRRAVPVILRVRAKWRVSAAQLAGMIQPETMAALRAGADEVVLSHITMDHTVYLPGTERCDCRNLRGTYAMGSDLTDGAPFRAVRSALLGPQKQRLELASINVRSIGCAYGSTY